MPRYWTPFQLSQETSEHLVDSKVEAIASPEDLVGTTDFIVVVPPDQQIKRFRAMKMDAEWALQELSRTYAAVVAALEHSSQLRTEREVLKQIPQSVDPLTSAVLLQLLDNTPELADNLQSIDAHLRSNELSRERWLNSCQSGLPLLKAWWSPHNGEADQMEVLLMQQQRQLQRLTQQLQSTSDS